MAVLSKMRVGARLALGFGTGLACAGVIGWFGLRSLNQVQQGVETIYHDRVEPLSYLKVVADMYAINIVDASHKARNGNVTYKEAVKLVDDAKTTIGEQWSIYEKTKFVPAEEKLVNEANSLFSAGDEATKKLRDILERNDSKALADFCTNDLYPSIEPISGKISELVELQLSVAKDEYAKAVKVRANAVLMTYLLIAFGVLAGIVSAIFVTLSITKPLAASVNVLKSVADGDLTGRVEASGKDELADLGREFNRAFDKLERLSSGVATMADQTRSAVSELAQSSDEVGEASTQISATIEQVATGSNSQAQQMNETAHSVLVLSEAVSQVSEGARKTTNLIETADRAILDISEAMSKTSDNARGTKLAAERVVEAATEGDTSVTACVHAMQKIQASTDSTAAAIRDLGSASERIGTIVGAIDDIASQTNLLALNAAIEAARAGEHGKGFAVVADEVRKLAERSSEQTKDITHLVSEIQQFVAVAITAMEDGSMAVSSGGEMVGMAGKSLEMIRTSVDDAVAKIEEVAAATAQVNASISGIRQDVGSLAEIARETEQATSEMASVSNRVSESIESISAFSEENAAAAQEVSATTQQQAANVQQIVATTQQVSRMAEELAEMVKVFKVRSVAQLQLEEGGQTDLRLAA